LRNLAIVRWPELPQSLLKCIFLGYQFFPKHGSELQAQQIQLVGSQYFEVIRHEGPPNHDRDDSHDIPGSWTEYGWSGAI
jgi:hypothetical protein